MSLNFAIFLDIIPYIFNIKISIDKFFISFNFVLLYIFIYFNNF